MGIESTRVTRRTGQRAGGGRHGSACGRLAPVPGMSEGGRRTAQAVHCGGVTKAGGTPVLSREAREGMDGVQARVCGS